MDVLEGNISTLRLYKYEACTYSYTNRKALKELENVRIFSCLLINFEICWLAFTYTNFFSSSIILTQKSLMAKTYIALLVESKTSRLHVIDRTYRGTIVN